MSALSAAVTDAVIRRLAGDRSYRRGLDYFRNGHVESLEDEDDGVRAEVRGTQLYTVYLIPDEGILDYGCDCPVGEDAAFCKHCVAAALAYLDRAAPAARKKARSKVKKLTLADAGNMLLAEDKDVLVRSILEWAKEDKSLRERILHYAARRAGPETAAAEARRTLQKSLRSGTNYLSYGEVRTWAKNVHRAIDAVEILLEDGQAETVIELCEAGIEGLLSAWLSADDSDGRLGAIRERLEFLHYAACEQARPDPVALAGRLFAFELNAGFDVFYGAHARYAELLGATGLEEYRRLAKEELSKIPARAANEDYSATARRSHALRIMESLVRASGDLEELVRVLSRDLSDDYKYVRIAAEYRAAGQFDKALQWAEKGLKAFPNSRGGRLREFAADEYHRLGRRETAMELIWAVFSEQPRLETYRTLRGHAEKAGSWPDWRERALAEIRRRIAAAKEQSRGRKRDFWMKPNDDHSPLVEIFLDEGDAEGAWREAREGGCSGYLWLRLAEAREKDHPAEAAPVYWQQAQEEMRHMHGHDYGNVVDLLIKAAKLMKRIDRSAEFVRDLEAMRTQYRMKRNFVKLLEQNRRSLYLS